LINSKSEGGRESHGESRYIILRSMGRGERAITVVNKVTVSILDRT
jgi:hypothetical protein